MVCSVNSNADTHGSREQESRFDKHSANFGLFLCMKHAFGVGRSVLFLSFSLPLLLLVLIYLSMVSIFYSSDDASYRSLFMCAYGIYVFSFFFSFALHHSFSIFLSFSRNRLKTTRNLLFRYGHSYCSSGETKREINEH